MFSCQKLSEPGKLLIFSYFSQIQLTLLALSFIYKYSELKLTVFALYMLRQSFLYLLPLSARKHQTIYSINSRDHVKYSPHDPCFFYVTGFGCQNCEFGKLLQFPVNNTFIIPLTRIFNSFMINKSFKRRDILLEPTLMIISVR